MFSLTQKKILKLLAINSRFTNKDIAKSVGVSPDTVDYQIQKLSSKKNYFSLSTLFNYHALGYFDYHLLIRCKDISQLPIDKLIALPFVTFVNSCYGGYDMQIIFVASSSAEFTNCFSIVLSLFKDNLQDYFVVSSNFFYKYSNVLLDFDISVSVPKNRKNVIYGLQNENYVDVLPKSISLDALDKKIVFELIKDSRVSYLAMSKKFSVSRETIRYRVERFIARGFLRSFFIKPNYSLMGYYTQFIFVKFTDVDESYLKEYFVNNKNIFYAGRLLGNYNCIFYVLSKSPEELSRVLKDFRVTFKDSILDMLLLHFESVYKEMQFPEDI